MTTIDQKLEVLIKRGSATAKNGFKNEADVVKKFNNWKKDEDAQKWIVIMGYNPKEIKEIKATQVTGSHKTDVQIEIGIIFKEGFSEENISIKLVSNPQGFNQIDKRWIDSYSKLWPIPISVVKILKEFTGENKPEAPSPRDGRRIFLDEISLAKQKEVVDFFIAHRMTVVADLFRGRDKVPASWMLIYQKDKKIWTLLPMILVMEFYGEGAINITSQGSLRIGKIGMQRKGGDNGRPTANMLQFKINPCEIVNSVLNDGQDH